MEKDFVYVKEFQLGSVDKREVLRYLGGKDWDEKTDILFEECINECSGVIRCKTCFSLYELSHKIIKEFCGSSKILEKNLTGCKKIILFSATIGYGIDSLIMKYTSVSPIKALMFQAIGTERVEQLCDKLCAYLKGEFGNILPRFSPGYGDFSLEYQKDIFRLLDCYKNIGLSLNDSLLMSPSKSVTAIVGVSEKCSGDIAHKCYECDKNDCIFRRDIK